MIHMLKSKEATEFFKNAGIEIVKNKSCHNFIHLKNRLTGEMLAIQAECDINIADGIPGVYVDERINDA